jgi:hypothetical protein
MKTSVCTIITFGLKGNSSDFQVAGWSAPEDSFTWSDGNVALLNVLAPDAPFGFFLEVDWSPAKPFPYISQQTVIVRINCRVVCCLSVDKPGLFAFFCPPHPSREKRMQIAFEFPNAFRPCDYHLSTDERLLAVSFRCIRIMALKEPWRVSPSEAYRARISYSDVLGMRRQAESISGVTLEELLHGFEMLAGNCDMGLALRELGFEKLSLLRFGGATVATAIKGLETDFVGVGQRISLSVANDPNREWMVKDESGLLFHSGQSSLKTDRANVEAGFPRYAEFLRRKLVEDLDESAKVFVYADHTDCAVSRSLGDVLPLYLALRRRSGARLLWVYPAGNDAHARGSVREILPGLAYGQLDLTAPPVLVSGGITVAGWLEILCGAWQAFH